MALLPQCDGTVLNSADFLFLPPHLRDVARFIGPSLITNRQSISGRAAALHRGSGVARGLLSGGQSTLSPLLESVTGAPLICWRSKPKVPPCAPSSTPLPDYREYNTTTTQLPPSNHSDAHTVFKTNTRGFNVDFLSMGVGLIAVDKPANIDSSTGDPYSNPYSAPSLCYLSLTRTADDTESDASVRKVVSQNCRTTSNCRSLDEEPVITIAVPPYCLFVRDSEAVQLSTSPPSTISPISSSCSGDDPSDSDGGVVSSSSPFSSSTPDDQCSVSSIELHENVNTAPPPDRQWIMLHRIDRDRPIATFTVMCYNVLCDKYATASLYSYCPSWALNWEYRKKAIMNDIRSFDCDIITLQEVETEQFQKYFLPELEANGYSGIFSAKSRAKTMSDEDKKYVDGCAIFWKVDKFELDKEHLIEFTQMAIQTADGSEHMLNRVMTRDNIALAAVLKIKDGIYGNSMLPPPPHENLVGNPVVVCTAHIHWDPEFCDVKLVQTMMLVHELSQLIDDVARTWRMNASAVPLMVCGDLNSLPNSGVFEFMTKGRVSSSHDDFKGFRDKGHCLQKLSASNDINNYTHSFRLESAYETNTIPFTNFTLDFKGIIDYIFATPSSLYKLGVLGPVDSNWLQSNKIIGCPHLHIPSDHIPILSQYAIVPPHLQRQQPPQNQQHTQQMQHPALTGQMGFGQLGRVIMETSSSFESATSHPLSPDNQLSPDAEQTPTEMGHNAADISLQEFQRMQESLIELRTNGYALEEEKKRLLIEVDSLRRAVRSGQDELGKALNIISRSQNAKTVESLDEEIRSMQVKLNTQEEEFRLQQSTLMDELNKVVRHSDSLDAELKALKTVNEIVHPNCAEIPLQFDNAQKDNTDSGLEEKLRLYESDIKDLLERERVLKESSATVKLELQNMNEKYRKKQESYMQLNAEKERQYEEYKKSLDSVYLKKEDEMNKVLDEMTRLKNELKVVGSFGEKETIWASERESLNQQILSLRADRSELQQVNEGFQIQLQETHSANDCLSSQVEGAKNDVLNMQKERDAAVKAAESRKAILNEMSEHLEAEKKELNLKIAELQQKVEMDAKKWAKKVENLQKQLEENRESNTKIKEMENDIQNLQKELEMSNNELVMEKDCKEVLKTNIADLMQKYEEETKEIVVKNGKEIEKMKLEWQEVKQSLETKIERMTEENKKLSQEVKDGEEQLKLVEKKQIAMVKDLKRQVNSEKKRAEKLTEKLQETMNEINRSRGGSPASNGFEEVKAGDLMEVPKRMHTDSGSVSSWTMLGAQKCDTPDKSNTVDNESTCSTHMLESDNVELMQRVATLQKKKSELEEKVSFLEETNAAMADDLVNKSSIIGQYVREKPTSILYPGHNSPERLPAGLKKMLDMVKMDFSAPDIRDTNKSLQLMLEETLIKNMNLQKDLEIMSQEIGRLSAPR